MDPTADQNPSDQTSPPLNWGMHDNHLEEFFIGSRSAGDILVTKSFIEDEDYGNKLFFVNFRKLTSQKKACFLILHGFGEHCTRYTRLGYDLAQADFDVFTFDFRGFGFSNGVRASTPLKMLFEDVVTVLNNVTKDLPLFILGHSMGGGTLISFLKLNPKIPIAGAIFTNPFIDFADYADIHCVKKILFRFVGAYVPVVAFLEYEVLGRSQ